MNSGKLICLELEPAGQFCCRSLIVLLNGPSIEGRHWPTAITVFWLSFKQMIPASHLPPRPTSFRWAWPAPTSRTHSARSAAARGTAAKSQDTFRKKRRKSSFIKIKLFRKRGSITTVEHSTLLIRLMNKRLWALFPFCLSSRQRVLEKVPLRGATCPIFFEKMFFTVKLWSKRDQDVQNEKELWLNFQRK